MKRWLTPLLAVAVAAVGVGSVVLSRSAAPSPAGKGPLLVSALLGNPAGHSGEVSVIGRVDAVKPDARLFGLADLTESEPCASSACTIGGPCALPVLCPGPLPQAGAIVVVTGRVTKSERGLVFTASKVSVP